MSNVPSPIQQSPTSNKSGSNRMGGSTVSSRPSPITQPQASNSGKPEPMRVTNAPTIQQPGAIVNAGMSGNNRVNSVPTTVKQPQPSAVFGSKRPEGNKVSSTPPPLSQPKVSRGTDSNSSASSGNNGKAVFGSMDRGSEVGLSPEGDVLYHSLQVFELARAMRMDLDILHIDVAKKKPPTEAGTFTGPRYLDHPQYDWPAWSEEFLYRFYNYLHPDAQLRLADFLVSGSGGARHPEMVPGARLAPGRDGRTDSHKLLFFLCQHSFSSGCEMLDSGFPPVRTMRSQKWIHLEK